MPDREAQSSSIEIKYCDYIWVEKSLGPVSFESPYWCIYYNSQVSAALEYRGIDTVLEPTWLYMIPPHTEGSARLLASSSHFYVYFDLRGGMLSTAPGVYRVPVVDFVLETIGALTAMGDDARYSARGNMFAQLLASYALARHDLDGQATAMDTRVQQSLGYINAFYSQTISVADMAHEHAMSREAFTRLFKQNTGESPYQLVTRLRINKARLLLENSQHSVQEIAHVVGYKDPYHFSNLFKRWTGQAPRNYRNTRRSL